MIVLPLFPPLPQAEELPSPVRECSCGAPIGDGDWASGKRRCAFHQRPPKRWTALPTPRR